MNKFIFCYIILNILISVTIQDDSPIVSLKPIIDTAIQEPNYKHLLNAIQFILTGKALDKNATSIFDQVATAPNDVTLSEMLIISTQQFFDFLKNNGYEEEDYADLADDWRKVLNDLISGGPDNVKLGELKQFIDLLRPENVANFMKKNNKAKKNFETYIYTDFLADVKDTDCKNHVAYWFQQLGQPNSMWALQMIDAVGKPPTGLFTGNINWVGSYKLCKKIEVHIGDNKEKPNFTGKYCRAKLKLPSLALPDGIPIDDNFGINVGLCVPNQCNNSDVKSIVNKSLQLMTLHKLIPVKDIKCEEDIPYSNSFYAFSIIFSAIIIFVIFATIYDGTKRAMKKHEHVELQDLIEGSKTAITGTNVVENRCDEKRPSKFIQFILNSSMYSNTERIFDTRNPGKFSCLNGIRAISMIWIVFSHSFKYVGEITLFFLTTNIRELKDLEESPAAQLIINGMYGVDTFFLMSAFLLTYTLMRKLDKQKSMSGFEWFYYYFHRYWRLLPPYVIIIAIYVSIIPWLGYGPLWNADEFPTESEDCRNYWWAYVLMINNFVPNGKGTACMGFLWYVCNDYQLYAISPIVLVILFKFPFAGLTLLMFLLASSVSTMAFLTANVYQSRGRDIILTLMDIWEDIYIKPYCRAGPWIIGIFLGYLFYKKNSIKINKFFIAIGWLLSACLALTTIFGGYTNHAKGWRRMETFEYASYFSLTRVAWPISISWVIFACYYGYGGVVNRFLSAKLWMPVAKISYSAYLVHPVLMLSYMYAQQGLVNSTELSLVYLFLGHLMATFILCFFYTLFFEMPFIALEKMVLGSRRRENSND